MKCLCNISGDVSVNRTISVLSMNYTMAAEYVPERLPAADVCVRRDAAAAAR